jgi:hypothetical protein
MSKLSHIKYFFTYSSQGQLSLTPFSSNVFFLDFFEDPSQLDDP